MHVLYAHFVNYMSTALDNESDMFRDFRSGPVTKLTTTANTSKFTCQQPGYLPVIAAMNPETRAAQAHGGDGTVRQPLLALLAKEPAHGYELKLALEQTFGQAYPSPNIGRIYVTLKRLEQDGLVRGGDIEAAAAGATSVSTS